MKKLDQFMDAIDHRIDRQFGNLIVFIQKHFSIVSSIILVSLFALFVVKTFYYSSSYLSTVINDDLRLITSTFASIDKECNILSIRGECVPVNFLTVKNFNGSTIGSINLAYPKKWQGPYCQSNPTLQGHYYDIVRVKEGYFVVPGQGVRLPNGFTIGKDITLNAEVSILPLLRLGGALNYKGQPLAMKLDFKIGDWDPVFKPSKEKIKKLNDVLQEFNQALSFSYNEAVDCEF